MAFGVGRKRTWAWFGFSHAGWLAGEHRVHRAGGRSQPGAAHPGVDLSRAAGSCAEISRGVFVEAIGASLGRWLLRDPVEF